MTFFAPHPAAVLALLQDVTREKVYIDDETFLIDRPDRADKLLDLPEVHEASRIDDYMPYWAELWPAARMLAKVLMKEPLPADAVALEMGCGLGLAGVVALWRGVEVVFSDYDASALRFAAENARINGFTKFRTLQLDWREPPADLKVSLVLGSDLTYEACNVKPIVECLRTILVPGGIGLVTDQNRIPGETFRANLTAAGFTYTTQPVKAGAPGAPREKGTLYRITRLA